MMDRTFSIQSNDQTNNDFAVEQSTYDSTIMTINRQNPFNNHHYHHHHRKKRLFFGHQLPSNYLLIKWILIIWLIGGIALYLLDIFLFRVSSTIQDIVNLPSDLIFLFAICNNFSLIIAILMELRPLLIVSIFVDCLLLVAIPALIVEVVPNLFTYASLMISIILSIYYGVLYMRYPLFYIDNTNHPYDNMMIGNRNRSNLPYDYFSTMTAAANSTHRFSFNSSPPPPQQQQQQRQQQPQSPLQSQQSTNECLTISGQLQPRRSCQF
ncbi:uncharacterized protein LOC124496500 [Dermatophagoides farinae]|uniref:Uncharacterized protein n=2 Tax=Dermatophagoides farinae TaxID=6954 RepID=A0A922LC31_DERFA|nr:uncharacterized protein LOC124496500 [Dermatophagoides farinae]KAH9530289.1 hypothetical protein DERF_004101 [Dermatophagoides farinae]